MYKSSKTKPKQNFCIRKYQLEKKKKKALKQKLSILKCPFVPRRPRNSFFTGNYSSEEEESHNDRAYQAYTQTHNLWMVSVQY